MLLSNFPEFPRLRLEGSSNRTQQRFNIYKRMFVVSSECRLQLLRSLSKCPLNLVIRLALFRNHLQAISLVFPCSLALEFRDFEEQYHLPKGIDLEANPEVALQESGSLPDTNAVETTPGVPKSDLKNDQKSDQKKRRKHRRRGERVPLPVPKELWQHNDPDAPFRAYTSDGRELTLKDAERWQKRMIERLAAFAKYGDPDVPINLDEPLIDVDQVKKDEEREVA
jgi:hypothetical protein